MSYAFAVEAAFGGNPADDPRLWTWQDITPWCFVDASPQPLVIERGRQDEMSEVQTSSLRLLLDNPDGRFTPGYVPGAYYPHVKLGVPLRVKVLNDELPRGLYVRPGMKGSAQSDYAAALGITGDLDIEITLQPESWRPATNELLAMRYDINGGENRSWALRLDTDGKLQFRWSTDGTFANTTAVTSTAAVPSTPERQTIRVTLDVNNGASGRTVTFYAGAAGTTPSILGSAVTSAGVTSVYAASGIGISLMSGTDGDNTVLTDTTNGRGYVESFTLRNGISGTVVASADFRDDAEPGAATYVDGVTRTWSVLDDAQFSDTRVRFAGHVAEWSPQWPYGDLSRGGTQDGEARCSVSASGILRRIDQFSAPLRSALYRGLSSGAVDGVIGYWPMEDGADSTSLATPVRYAKPANYSLTAGLVELAAYSDAPASDAIPTFTLGGSVTAQLSNVGHTNYTRAMVYFVVPTEGVTSDVILLTLSMTGGTYKTWKLKLDTAGDLSLIRVANDDTVTTNGPVNFNTNGRQGMAWIYLVQNGSDIDTQFGTTMVDTAVSLVSNQTVTSATKGDPVSVIVLGSGDPNSMAVGHLTVLNSADFWTLEDLARGNAGETAAARLARLCSEESIPYSSRIGDDDTAPMGPQRIAALGELLRECADADGGVLYEARDFAGLVYRSRTSMYDAEPLLELDAARNNLGDIVPPLEPTLDDALVSNSVTVSRDDGTSYTAEDAADIAARGRYEASVTLNLYDDGQVPDAASWLLRLGTWPGMRYPTVSPALDVMPDLVGAYARLDVGDMLTVANLPPQHPDDGLRQLAQGFSESLSPFRWESSINTTPADSWTTAEVWDGTSAAADGIDRMDTEASELQYDLDADDTSFSVMTTVGPLWVDSTNYASDFPFDILVGGERMRVTAVSVGSGTAPAAQTFTVTRSTNGIVKAHAAGVAVGLAVPAYAAR